jgi:hypothetical protein
MITWLRNPCGLKRVKSGMSMNRIGMDVLLWRRATPSLKPESYAEFKFRWNRIEETMQWLQENTHKLMKCGIPDCRRNRYFIRETGEVTSEILLRVL